MATLVKFYIGYENDEVLAYFPQLNYAKVSRGNTVKLGYTHIGQHTAVHIDYIKECSPANFEQYKDLATELRGVGYDLKILNRD